MSRKLKNETVNNAIETAKNDAVTVDTVTVDTVVSNSEKTDTVIDFDALYTALCECKTKVDMITAYGVHGITCTTAPTTTPNTNDLYAQFNRVNCGDLSRIQLTSRSIKLFVTETVSTALSNAYGYVFDVCNDGGKRVRKTTLPKTVDTFTDILNTFIECGVIAVK